MPENKPAAKLILYLDHAPIFGGAEVVLLNLVKNLDREHWLPLVATSDNPDFRSALDQANIESIRMLFGRLNRAGALLPIHLVQAACAVIRIIHDRNVNLIHTNTVRTHIIGSLAAVLTHTPLIWSLHDNTFPQILVKVLARIPRRVICVSQWINDWYAPSVFSRTMTVIHNGLDTSLPLAESTSLRAELDVPPDAPFIICVGRIVHGKAPHLFVQAAQQAHKTHPNAYFALVGGADRTEPGREPDPYPEILAREAQQSGLNEHLILTGQRVDVGRFYAAADALVYTSVQPEGLPTVLLEAMQYALPVVASSIGGASEIVEDGLTGWCVPSGDVDALANAILHLLSDRDHARALGENGSKRLAQEFNLQNQVAQTQTIYDLATSRQC
jgi:glycosyltransferase involved in cell wall biosynthesis